VPYFNGVMIDNMKKIFALAFATLLFSQPVKSNEINFGFIGALGFNHLLGSFKSFDPDLGADVKVSPSFGGLGFGLGIASEFFMSESTTLDVAFMWTRRMYKTEAKVLGINLDLDFTLQQLELPVIYSWLFSQSEASYWKFGAGIMPRLGVGKVKMEISGSGVNLSTESTYSEAQLEAFSVRPVLQLGYFSKKETFKPYGLLRLNAAILKENKSGFADSGNVRPMNLDMLFGVLF
jgi:hypothetical protein